jgi:NAD+ kinase
VHPSRRLDGVLDDVGRWASARGAAIGQVQIEGQTRRVAEPVQPGDCDLLIAVGGDGTTLAALHAGAPHSRPVLGIACGSIGVLTSVVADHATSALDQIEAGRWTAADVPGLELAWSDGASDVAINDLVVIRDGPGQLFVTVTVDGELYAHLAGDGLVVATALGSSAYTMAAGGPLLAPGATGIAVTPLAPHAGSCPPLVAGADSRLSLTIDPGYGGVRHEVDGRRSAAEADEVTVRLRLAYAKLVQLADEESRLAGLRRRKLVVDSPRVLVREARSAHVKPPGPPPSA